MSATIPGAWPTNDALAEESSPSHPNPQHLQALREYLNDSDLRIFLGARVIIKLARMAVNTRIAVVDELPEDYNFFRQPIVSKIGRDTQIDPNHYWIAIGTSDEIMTLQKKGPAAHHVEILRSSSLWQMKFFLVTREEKSWWNPIGFSSFPHMAIELQSWSSQAIHCSHLVAWLMNLKRYFENFDSSSLVLTEGELNTVEVSLAAT
ncbi:hypothetical protein, variant [Cladophialophora immunda]|uniref:Uncharacterized protein n=1 Tax=Cladophialophora immunda TaxID=569365 RepID=A0A0D2BRM2_9EURO|nr:hypothetical protein, variant [Cladophialophora immunda]KIW21728.1 hypothetical protein, variant [Cladophialophora immunda]